MYIAIEVVGLSNIHVFIAIEEADLSNTHVYIASRETHLAKTLEYIARACNPELYIVIFGPFRLQYCLGNI